MTVRLWDHEVAAAPASVLERAMELAEQELLDQDTMVGLGGGRGRFLGRADLAYTRRSLQGDLAGVGDDHDSPVLEVERRCNPGEVDEAGLSTMDHCFVVRDARGRPAAAAGYQVQANILAQLGVLTVPAYRGQGLARRASAGALNHAVDRGLVAQWRSRAGHKTSTGLGARLGFERIGYQVTLLSGTR